MQLRAPRQAPSGRGKVASCTRPAAPLPRSASGAAGRADTACRSPSGPQQRRNVAVANNWKVFGPSAEYSDGDAEFFRLTSQLSDQYEWFAPRPQEEQPVAMPEQEQQQQRVGPRQGRVARPEFGLTPREIAALGLSGQQRNMPDPATLSSRHYMRGDPFNPADPSALGFSATMARAGLSTPSTSAAAAAAGGGAGGSSGYGAPADLWGAGVLMHQLLTGFFPQWPQAAGGGGAGGGRLVPAARAALADVAAGTLRLDTPAFAGLSDAARDLLRALLSRDPDARPAAARALEHPWFAAAAAADGAPGPGAAAA